MRVVALTFVVLLALTQATPMQDKVTKLIHDARSLEEASNFPDQITSLTADADEIIDEMETTFPYHGPEHAKLAPEYVKHATTRVKGYAKLNTKIAKFAMHIHDMAYAANANGKGFLVRDLSFNADPTREDERTDTQDTRSGIKLGEDHEVDTAVTFLGLVEDNGMDLNADTQADVLTVLSMICSTKLFADPAVLLEEVLETPYDTTTWGVALGVDGEAKTAADVIEDNAKYNEVAEAADFAYFWYHAFNYMMQTSKLRVKPPMNWTPICHLLACFAEFYSYGGITANTGNPQKSNTVGFAEAFDDFMERQGRFREFVWLGKLTKIEPKLVEVLRHVDAWHISSIESALIAASKAGVPAPTNICDLLEVIRANAVSLENVSEIHEKPIKGKFDARPAVKEKYKFFTLDSIDCSKFHSAFDVCD